MKLVHRRGTLAGPDAGDHVLLTAQTAGWRFSGLRVVGLDAGAPRTVATADTEVFVLPLSGGCRVQVASAAAPGTFEADYQLDGRRSVFSGVTDFAYAGRDSLVTLTSDRPTEVALPAAVCTDRRAPAYGRADDVPVETRGSGPASRQVIGFGIPGAWDHAEKLVACELLTPPGNWSSYPPHKHDRTDPCPVVNEEIYYYRIAGPDQVSASAQGFGLHRTYTGPEHLAAGLDPIDLDVTVRDGDVVLVPYGYHGPCVAAPGYPMYYLNVLAGPGADRSMAFCDDPAHGWVRATWDQQDATPQTPPAASGHAARNLR